MSLETFSINFNKCRNIYPIRIIRPCNKFKVDEQLQIKSVLDEINDNGLCIYCAVFDKLKRTVAKCSLSHSAYFGCEYCECPAKLYSHPDATKTKKHLVWPYETRKGKLRTVNSVIDIAHRTIENGGPLDRHEAKGIVGKSHFLSQPNFHFFRDMPCEYMHLMCLGSVKRLFTLTFKVGENRDRITKRKLSDPSLYNFYISQIQVIREFSRRCRNLDVSVFKAQEYRNAVLFFFPIIIKCIEPDYTNEIKVWYYIVYMIRSCVIPNDEFRNLSDSKINYACENFYRLYEKVFGKTNCTYSIHVMSSHLLLIRGSQPLTFKSAFKFESFFSEMRNMYVPGTVSTVKQILQNCYMKRAVEFHTCEKSVFYDCKKSPVEGKVFLPGLEDNSLIYVTDENNGHHMYQIVEKNKNLPNVLTCIKQGKFEFKNELTPALNWSQVGVYKAGPTFNDEKITVNKEDISGKVLKVDNYLITCPLNVLQEK